MGFNQHLTLLHPSVVDASTPLLVHFLDATPDHGSLFRHQVIHPPPFSHPRKRLVRWEQGEGSQFGLPHLTLEVLH